MVKPFLFSFDLIIKTLMGLRIWKSTKLKKTKKKQKTKWINTFNGHLVMCCMFYIYLYINGSTYIHTDKWFKWFIEPITVPCIYSRSFGMHRAFCYICAATQTWWDLREWTKLKINLNNIFIYTEKKWTKELMKKRHRLTYTCKEKE